ncbi:MAG TPA: K(+)-transporting ATPase subunit F [Cyanobacteria bacterium UBA11149]|nr:K(+)-transporting ATPase subunit F [Cyanobacteria bacterium UBA11367]HBE56665.1 K(+)-transporting ATPase subunit F [Cyanobacteria bacterium UBA11366]HBK66365.1 K(+)-transporting ATPase subunit F [Cyanobacteria bacterium UBA11166]HBR74131.1 K(+)-transporting ATPase subunit F [Cyanobacteria bacterium UBA11159]HBS71342.1 K(+)-transporting ATPase subunit F [Cyanobacteria bacterium UBA11153]HBW87623.1 K(+)-transporting ATPase subunit F [Cyanobacteria bacterium UBA11149]HCA95087.1 K(+)-transport
MKEGYSFREGLLRNGGEVMEMLREFWYRHPLPIQLFVLLCLNLAIAPAVDAATGGEITRKVAYAIGILGMVVVGLCVYLFVVIFQPERF